MKYHVKGHIRYEFIKVEYINIDGVFEGADEEEVKDQLAEDKCPFADGELYDTDSRDLVVALINETPDEISAEQAAREASDSYWNMRRMGVPTLVELATNENA